MTRRRRCPGAALLALAALASGATGARAQDVVLDGTLATVLSRGTFLLGHRRASVPFAFANRAGQPVGFSVDLCRGIAADVARALNRDLVEPDAPAWQTGVRIVMVPVAADDRIPAVTSGRVDIECGATTANAERAKSVAFSPVFFLAGTKLLVRDPAIRSYRDLAGKRVGVGAGTTNAAAFERIAASVTPPIAVVPYPELDPAYDAVAAGTLDAVASDDILLYGAIAARPERRDLKVVGDFLSFEPYGLAYRRDDPRFAGLVRASFERMARDGLLARLYARWFTDTLPTGENLRLPMSAQLAEMYRALGQPD